MVVVPISDSCVGCCACILCVCLSLCFKDPATTESYTYVHTLSLHDALPISCLADCEAAMHRIAAAIGDDVVAVVGGPQAAGSVVYNAASVLRGGRIERTCRKRELPNYAVFDERRYFDVDPDGEACVFDFPGLRVGLLICEDLCFPDRKSVV